MGISLWNLLRSSSHYSSINHFYHSVLIRQMAGNFYKWAFFSVANLPRLSTFPSCSRYQWLALDFSLLYVFQIFLICCSLFAGLIVTGVPSDVYNRKPGNFDYSSSLHTVLFCKTFASRFKCVNQDNTACCVSLLFVNCLHDL